MKLHSHRLLVSVKIQLMLVADLSLVVADTLAKAVQVPLPAQSKLQGVVRTAHGLGRGKARTIFLWGVGAHHGEGRG